MILGFVLTALNIALNVVLIRGLGPIPAYRTAGAAMGTAIASGLVATYAVFVLKYARTEASWIVRPLVWYALLPYAVVLLVARLRPYVLEQPSSPARSQRQTLSPRKKPIELQP